MKKVLVPVFQPVVDMLTRQITFYEALARRMDGSDGHGRLIELGENFGFIHLVDLGILAQVVRVLEGQPCVSVSVNVSVMTIENALGEYLSLVFAHMEVADRLVFEITETVQVKDFDKIDRFVDGVRLAGSRVAIDDFGDGHATMALVERTRPDFVKLPSSMIERMRATCDVQPLVGLRTKIEALGASVIAEYVDSKEKVDLLLKAGIRHGQGFFIGRHEKHPVCDRSACPPDAINCGMGWEQPPLRFAGAQCV